MHDRMSTFKQNQIQRDFPGDILSLWQVAVLLDRHGPLASFKIGSYGDMKTPLLAPGLHHSEGLLRWPPCFVYIVPYLKGFQSVTHLYSVAFSVQFFYRCSMRGSALAFCSKDHVLLC